jgi:hypothetical protein
MRKVETITYNYYDMIALETMTPKEVIEFLKYAYRGYINKYEFPTPEKDEYSDTEYYNYKMQCAFFQACEYLERIEEDD